MRFESQQRAWPAEPPGEAQRAHDHAGMAAMQPIEIADRNDRALQPRRRSQRVDRDAKRMMDYVHATIIAAALSSRLADTGRDFRGAGNGGSAHPFGMRRNLLTFHDNGEWSEPRVIADTRVIKHGRTGAHRHAMTDMNAANFHYAIFIEMRLQRRRDVKRAIIPDGHAIEFGDVRHVGIDAFAEPCPE